MRTTTPGQTATKQIPLRPQRSLFSSQLRPKKAPPGSGAKCGYRQRRQRGMRTGGDKITLRRPLLFPEEWRALVIPRLGMVDEGKSPPKGPASLGLHRQ
jgi:hypothetical protein